MRFYGMMRIKNEAAWIRECIESQLPLVERLFVLDDHSEDDTPTICRQYDKITLIRSPFDGLNEQRDKQFMLDMIYGITWEWRVEPVFLVCLDGDEILERTGPEKFRALCEANPGMQSISFKVEYLWDRPDQVRTDGVYGRFRRPSAYRLFNPSFKYQTTPWGGNLHCAQVPQELLYCAVQTDIRLKHYGYMARDKRIAKYQWYNTVDPNNEAEDRYRHVVQGDVPDVPAGAQLKWAGPLQLAPWVE